MGMTVGELVAYLDVDRSKFDSGLHSAERGFKSFGGRLGGIATKVGGVAMMGLAAGVTAVGAATGVAAAMGIKYNSSIEQTTIAMGTMLGSTDKAKALIDEVTTMAAKTPFEFPELADATKRLVAYGVAAEDAVPLMTRLGDISSALQIPIGELSDIYGKMKVSGRIQMEDINQLAGRGIPIYSTLAKVLGTSEGKVRDLVTAGKVGFPDVQKAFELMTDKGSMFGGMMDKQSKSFAGQWSTIKDGFTQLFGTVMKPAFDWLSRTAMPALSGAMPAIQAAVTGAMSAIGRVVKPVIAAFKEGGIGGALSALGGVIQRALPVVGRALAELGQKFIAWIEPLIPPLVEKLGKLAEKFIAWIVPLIPPILAALAKIALKIVWWVVSSLLPAVVRALAGIAGQLAKSALSLMGKAGSAIVNGIWNGLKAAWGAFVGYLRSLPGKVKSQLDFYTDMVTAGAKLVRGLWAGISSLSGWLWDKVSDFATGIYDSVKKGLGKLWPGSPSQAGIDLGYFLGVGIEKGIKAGMPGVNRAVSGLASAMGLQPYPGIAVAGASAGGHFVTVAPGAVVVNVNGSQLSHDELTGAVRSGVEPALVRLAREIGRL